MTENNQPLNREEYEACITESRAAVQTLIENNLQIHYVRNLPYKRSEQHTATREQVQGIRKLLNQVGTSLTPTQALPLLNFYLTPEHHIPMETADDRTNARLLYRNVRRHLLSRQSGIKGTIVSFQRDGHTLVGWSQWNPMDRFNRYIGIFRAIERAIELSKVIAIEKSDPRSRVWVKETAPGVHSSESIPHDIYPELIAVAKHLDRAKV